MPENDVTTAEERKRYHLSDGATKQFLFAVNALGEYGGETTPVIYWAGDMDGDGKLDLLMGIPDESYFARIFRQHAGKTPKAFRSSR